MQEAFKKIIERLEEYAHGKICKMHSDCPYRDNPDVECENCGALGTIEIVNQIAEEHGKDTNVPSNGCDLISKSALMEDIRNTITEMSSTMDWLNLINRQPVVSDSGWIPCSEELPSDGEIHECTAQFNTGMRYIEYAYYDIAREEWWTHDDTGLINVIAWKPLPEPYKEE